MSDPRNLLSSLGGGAPQTPSEPPPAAPPSAASPRSAPPASATPRAPVSSSAPPASAGPTAARPPVSAGPTLRSSAPMSASYDEPARRPPTLLFSGVAILLALGSGGAFLLKPSAPAVVPKAYAAFSAPDNVFRCEVPQGWDKQASGELAGEDRVNASDGIIMRSGSAQVEVTLSNAAALARAQLLFGSSTVPESFTDGKAIGVSRLHKTAVKKRFGDYKEVKQTDCPSKMGGIFVDTAHKIQDDALLYEFTASNAGFLNRGPKHGYRAVVAGRDLIASVECHCSEAEWKKMKPVFQHIIGNLREVHPETAEEREAKALLKQLENMPPPQPGQ